MARISITVKEGVPVFFPLLPSPETVAQMDLTTLREFLLTKCNWLCILFSLLRRSACGCSGEWCDPCMSGCCPPSSKKGGRGRLCPYQFVFLFLDIACGLLSIAVNNALVVNAERSAQIYAPDFSQKLRRTRQNLYANLVKTYCS